MTRSISTLASAAKQNVIFYADYATKAALGSYATTALKATRYAYAAFDGIKRAGSAIASYSAPVVNTVADYTVPTVFRQATLPTVQQHQERIEAYHRVLNTNPTQAPITDYRPKTDEQRKKFARNLSEFATLKTVYEIVCGLTVDPAHGNLYNELMERPENLTEAEHRAKLREKFFEHLDTRNISVVKRWSAYIAYDILNSIFHDIIESISSDLLKDVREKIEREENTSSFAQIGNQCIRYLSGYLETLMSAYGRIHRNENACSALDQELAKELNVGLQNRGYTQAELNKKFTEKFVQKYTYSVKWTATLEKKIKSFQISEASFFSFLNIPLHALTSLLAWTVWAALYIPQAATNLAIAYAFKILLTKIDLVDEVVSNSVKAITHPNGYTHALNRAIYKQLKDIFVLIQRPPSPTETPKIKLHGLKPLIENLQEILKMDQLGTREKLIEHFKEKDRPKGVVGSTKQYAFNKTNDAAVEAIIKVISTGYESFMKKDQLEEQLYNVLNHLNMIYTRDADIDPTEFEATEKGISEMTDAIITSLIDDNLRKAFDGTAQQVSSLKDRYVDDLKRFTAQITETGRMIGEISFDPALNEEALAANLGVFQRFIRHISLIDSQIALTQRIIETTPPNVLGAAAKRDLAERFANPLNQHLNELKNAIVAACEGQQKILAYKAHVLPPLGAAVIALNSILEGAQGLPLNPETVKSRIATGQEAFDRLSRMGIFQDFTRQNSEPLARIQQHFNALEQAQLSITILTPCESRLETMFQAAPNSTDRRRLETELRAHLERLPVEDKQRTLDIFNRLCVCQESERDLPLTTFLRILEEARGRFAREKESLILVANQLFITFSDEEVAKLTEHNNLIGQLGQNQADIVSALERIPTFANSSSSPPWSFSGLPGQLWNGWSRTWRWTVSSLVNMNGPHDLIQDKALGILKQDSEKLLGFIRQEHNYRHGVFNHLLFMPFVEN